MAYTNSIAIVTSGSKAVKFRISGLLVKIESKQAFYFIMIERVVHIH